MNSSIFLISHWLFSFDNFVVSLLSCSQVKKKKTDNDKSFEKNNINLFKMLKMLDYQNEMLTFPHFSVLKKRFPKLKSVTLF